MQILFTSLKYMKLYLTNFQRKKERKKERKTERKKERKKEKSESLKLCCININLTNNPLTLDKYITSDLFYMLVTYNLN